MMNRQIILLLAAVILLTLTACTTTPKLAGSWKEESLVGKRLQSILVIGTARKPERRKLFEDEFVRQLKGQNIKAIPSYTIIPADKMLDKNAISEKISELGVDSVLISRLTGIKEERDLDASNTSNTYRVPYAYYNRMHEYYKYSLESESPSPLTTHKVISLETNIYIPETEKLVWATTSDVQVQDTLENLTKAYIKAVINKMLSDQVI